MSQIRKKLAFLATKQREKLARKKNEDSNAVDKPEYLLSEDTDGKRKTMSNRQLLTESEPVKLLIEKREDGRIIARGNILKLDVPTKNGRIYPTSIMRREINKLSEAIDNRRAFGELDHPCLTSDDFRVLTVNGWKEFRDIGVGDRVWSRVDGKAVVSKVTDIINQQYDGDAYHVKGRSIDSTFTPEHKLILDKRPDSINVIPDEKFVTVKDVAKYPEKFAHHAIPKTARWFSESIKKVVIPGINVKSIKRFKNDVSKDLELDSKLFAAFIGIYLSEGSCSSDSTDNYDINIHQKTEWSKKFIYNEILSKFPDDLVWRDVGTGYALSDARLYFYLKKLGNVYTKRIPDEVKNLNCECLKELIFWFCIGDGRMVASNSVERSKFVLNDETVKEAIAESLRKNKISNTRQDVFSVSKQLIYDLYECLIKSGCSGSIKRIDPDQDYNFADHEILSKNKVPLYQLHISQTKSIWMNPNFISVEKVHHSGNIYCLSTTYGSFYMEKEGYSFWTGNSDGKTKLTRTSHIATKYEIRDGWLYAESEILNTPNGKILKSLIEHQCNIGSSIRGFGSTTSVEGGEKVCEDYNFRTFDYVGDPASDGAYQSFYSESVEETDDEDPVVKLKNEFPEIVKQLEESVFEKAQKKAEGSISELVSAAEQKVRDESRENFEKQLAEQLVELRSSIIEEVRKEMTEDPDVAASKGVVLQIAEMVRPYLMTPDEQIVDDTLKAKDLEISTVTEERDTAIKAAQEAAYRLYMEQQVSGHPMAGTIRSLMSGVESDSIEDFKVKLETIMSDLTGFNFVNEEDDKVKDLESKVDDLRKRLTKAVEIGEELNAQLQEASEKAERLDEAEKKVEEYEELLRQARLNAFKAESVAGFKNSDALLSLLEDVKDEKKVGKIVRENGVKKIADPELRRMKEELRRGKVSQTSLEEGDESGTIGDGDAAVTSIMGESLEVARKLSGIS